MPSTTTLCSSAPTLSLSHTQHQAVSYAAAWRPSPLSLALKLLGLPLPRPSCLGSEISAYQQTNELALNGHIKFLSHRSANYSPFATPSRPRGMQAPLTTQNIFGIQRPKYSTASHSPIGWLSTVYLTVSFSGRFTGSKPLHPLGLERGGDTESLDMTSGLIPIVRV